jgi:signal transduction histidine kinase
MSPLTNPAGAVIGAAVIARDISEQRRAQEALSSVSRRLIHAQEEERARIARELHDDIGQRLAMLTVNLAARPDGLNPLPNERRRRTRLFQEASQIATDVQALSHSALAEARTSGLAAAMKGYYHEFADQRNAAVEFSNRDRGRGFPSNVSLCLFRVLQEALHNAVKQRARTST